MQSETSEDSHFHVCFVKWGGRSITGSVVRVQPGHCPPCSCMEGAFCSWLLQAGHTQHLWCSAADTRKEGVSRILTPSCATEISTHRRGGRRTPGHHGRGLASLPDRRELSSAWKVKV